MNGVGSGRFSNIEMEYIRRHHRHQPGHNQCASALVKHIRAPVPQVTLLFNFFDAI
jgi:abscisic acid receptor (PYR/PYL family)